MYGRWMPRRRKTRQNLLLVHGVPASSTINSFAARERLGPIEDDVHHADGSSSVTTTIGWHSTIVLATTTMA